MFGLSAAKVAELARAKAKAAGQTVTFKSPPPPPICYRSAPKAKATGRERCGGPRLFATPPPLNYWRTNLKMMNMYSEQIMLAEQIMNCYHDDQSSVTMAEYGAAVAVQHGLGAMAAQLFHLPWIEERHLDTLKEFCGKDISKMNLSNGEPKVFAQSLQNAPFATAAPRAPAKTTGEESVRITTTVRSETAIDALSEKKTWRIKMKWKKKSNSNLNNNS